MHIFKICRFKIAIEKILLDIYKTVTHDNKTYTIKIKKKHVIDGLYVLAFRKLWIKLV